MRATTTAATAARKGHNTRSHLHVTCRAQYGRLPLHIAAMQQGGEAETVVALLLNAHPAGAKEKDNVRCRTILALCSCFRPASCANAAVV